MIKSTSRLTTPIVALLPPMQSLLVMDMLCYHQKTGCWTCDEYVYCSYSYCEHYSLLTIPERSRDDYFWLLRGSVIEFWIWDPPDTHTYTCVSMIAVLAQKKFSEHTADSSNALSCRNFLDFVIPTSTFCMKIVRRETWVTNFFVRFFNYWAI